MKNFKILISLISQKVSTCTKLTDTEFGNKIAEKINKNIIQVSEGVSRRHRYYFTI